METWLTRATIRVLKPPKQNCQNLQIPAARSRPGRLQGLQASRLLSAGPFNLNGTQQTSGEAREAFPASSQASTSSGASVGEMTPRYPQEAYSQDHSSRQGQGGQANPAGQQPDLPTDRSVLVGQPHTTVADEQYALSGVTSTRHDDPAQAGSYCR